MTATIKQGSTLLAFSNGNGYIFYGENARKAAAALGDQTNSTARGVEYLQISEHYRAIAEPRLVATGYKLAILEA